MKLSQGQVMTTSKGLVFDIKRFAVHDGQGIRTTVFLKGCPLRCLWCQNPEGMNPKANLLYMENLCMNCGQCVQSCIHQGVIYKNGKRIINQDAKEDWDMIVDVCPTRALRWDSQIYDVDSLIEEVMKDQVFFQYEGGVTFSGGEPFVQYPFLKECLMRLNQQGIHTAIETTLYTEWEKIESVLEYVDQIYCDYKIEDDESHREYTGVSNQFIKENIKRLLQSVHGHKVIVRTPPIPSVNASEKNIRQIAKQLSSWNQDVKWELLNYNPLAPAKYVYLSKRFLLQKTLKAFTKKEMEKWIQVAKISGIRNIIQE